MGDTNGVGRGPDERGGDQPATGPTDRDPAEGGELPEAGPGAEHAPGHEGDRATEVTDDDGSGAN